jgi:hypothetical protein
MKTTFTKIILLSILFLGVQASAEAQTRTLNESDAYSIKTFTASPGEKLEVRTSGGSIQVYGTDGNEVKVEMYVRRNSTFLSPSDDDLSTYDVDINQSRGVVRASAVRRSGVQNILSSRSNLSISFVVSIPNSFNIDISTSGGSIRVSDLDGDLVAQTSGGSIRMANLNGKINFRTSGGSITAEEIHGAIDARTSGGSIRVTNASGKISMRTSGGSMTFENIQGELEAHTSGGSIRANIAELSGDLSLKTSGGSITARIPKDIGANLDIRGDRVNVPLNNFSGNSSRNRINGTMNGGGHTIVLSTSGGRVNLDFD